MSIKQSETKLTARILASWDRVRSGAEINNFLTRRELALARVEIDNTNDR